MSALATMCQCCKEECGKLVSFDSTLGSLCSDCAEGIYISAIHLKMNGARGIYHGPCPDNGKDGVK